jgi:polysaccharide biosynthesis/export protein
MLFPSDRPALRLFFFFLLISFSSCRVYQQNIMFRTDGDIIGEKVAFSKAEAEKNYIIRPNDYIDVRVYTNKGERILDPNHEFSRSIGAGGGGVQGGAGGAQMLRAQPGLQQGFQEGQQYFYQPQFLVQHDGSVRLPMIGVVNLSGYSLTQADSLLQEKYFDFYVDPFVVTQVLNNRIIVLGAFGGNIVPYYHDNMSLIEVLAQVGGVGQNGKAYNIRLIRGDLSNPSVQVIDLSTIEGMRRASLQVEPNDIIYIEPVRRVFFEALRDVTPVIGALTSALTLYLFLQQITGGNR